jgi:hypothetical protein
MPISIPMKQLMKVGVVVETSSPPINGNLERTGISKITSERSFMHSLTENVQTKELASDKRLHAQSVEKT